ncbi:MAG: ATP-dependent RecD-like DNA helicase [Verrucomicrobiales bacterium]|nr:ATP-dependent RecD-like DNA helicase [Verrucomicrobiales bacterium]
MSATLPDPIDVEGTVHSIVFHNEENGYTIMQVATGTEGILTVLGSIPAVVEGELIKAFGNWKKDRKFGRQFEASRIEAVAPTSIAGIERFLASGLIDGVGKAYAKRIVGKFGTDTFRIIEEESQRLQEVPGIGKGRRLTIKNSWKRQKSVRDIMIFLHEHGLSTARALRLYKTYGEETVGILRADPYRLAREITGVGFKTADEIAQKMGQAVDSPKRLEAGIQYVLEQAEHQGHCALPREDLIEQSMETLGSPREAVKTIIDQLILDTRLIAEKVGEQTLIFPGELYEAEQVVAKSILTLISQAPTLPAVDAEAAIEWFERHNTIKLGGEQAAAVIEATKHRFFVITGGPGVGKTTIMNAVLQILMAKKVKPVLCAPTGRAARQLAESTGQEAGTIHRTLEYQPQAGFTRNAETPLEGDLFIIDEASMIDIRLMAQVMSAIPPKGNVLLVGDVDQLPSVGPGSVLNDIIRSEAVPVARLTQIFRQAASSRIVTASHEVNLGHLPPLDNDAESDFFFIERNQPDEILSTVKHLISERIPEKFKLNARDDIQVLTPMNRQSLGTGELNASLQEKLNPPAEGKFEIDRFGNTFRVGDKVIQTRNNYEKEIFNGDIGHIAEITTEPVTIYVTFDGQSVTYEPGELDELQLAYAITIHKSQGSEFPAIVVPLASQHYMMLQRNLLYTAITRGKRLVIIVGDRRSLESAVRNRERGKRWTGLQNRLMTRPPSSSQS